MQKKLFYTCIAFIIMIAAFSCKKENINHNAALVVGSWQYKNSTIDSFINNQWKGPQTAYDNSVATNFAEALTFTAADTVYYSYSGITSWTNYSVKNELLILKGSAVNDTLTIHSIDNTSLQIGRQNSQYVYWMNFVKY